MLKHASPLAKVNLVVACSAFGGSFVAIGLRLSGRPVDVVEMGLWWFITYMLLFGYLLFRGSRQ